MCEKKAGCTQWAWHEQAQDCHAHSAASELRAQKGTVAAYMPNTTRSPAEGVMTKGFASAETGRP